MLQDLKQIQNPVARSATAGLTVSSFILIVSALGLGFFKLKETHKIAVLGALTGGGVGAISGAVIAPTKAKSKPTSPKTTHTGHNEWKNWRPFVVRRKVKESEEITSFYLEPEDGGPLPGFKPGQFLTLQLEIPGQPRPVIRTYSLSDYAEQPQYYRLSIKREPAPKNLDVPPGIASNFMHDQVHEGTVLPAKPPNGKFFLDLNKTAPAILISNGVGITPMISMAKACKQQGSQRTVWFLHGARNGQFHALRDEVNDIGVNVLYRYSRPRPEDEGQYQSTGYIDAALIESEILPALQQQHGSTTAEYFLCGSPPFMDGIRAGLRDLGVPEENVYFESFSKGPKAKSDKTTAPVEDTAESTVATSEVVFAKSGKTLTWKPSDGTLLEFAEANNIDPPYSCRAGVCLTCMCPLQEGEVNYEEEPNGTPDEGSVLICISKPGTERVVLDL